MSTLREARKLAREVCGHGALVFVHPWTTISGDSFRAWAHWPGHESRNPGVNAPTRRAALAGLCAALAAMREGKR